MSKEDVDSIGLIFKAIKNWNLQVEMKNIKNYFYIFKEIAYFTNFNFASF